MANVIMVLGKSGTGKSQSIKGLDPKRTVVISVLGKRMLFDKERNYSAENKNFFKANGYREVISLIENISSKGENVDNIVIDDMIYIMSKEFLRRATETGYGKFSEMGAHFEAVLTACENARESINIFMMLHAEETYSDKIHTGWKARTIGNMVDAYCAPTELVNIQLFADVRFNAQGKAEYGFYTHKIKNGTIEIPAKSGDLFEEDWIPNDLGLVVSALN